MAAYVKPQNQKNPFLGPLSANQQHPVTVGNSIGARRQQAAAKASTAPALPPVHQQLPDRYRQARGTVDPKAFQNANDKYNQVRRLRAPGAPAHKPGILHHLENGTAPRIAKAQSVVTGRPSDPALLKYLGNLLDTLPATRPAAPRVLAKGPVAAKPTGLGQQVANARATKIRA